MRSLLASFLSPGRVPSFRYSIIGVIHVVPSSSTIVATSSSCMDFSLSISTKTCLDRCAKLVDAILLKASAFLFLLHGTWFIEKLAKPPDHALGPSQVMNLFYSLANTSLGLVCLQLESTLYRAHWLAHLWLLSETGYHLVMVMDPSTHDDPSVNNVYGSCGASTTGVFGGFLSAFSTMKSARICPFTDVRGRGSSDKCCFNCLKACSSSGVQWKSLFLMHLFKVLNSGKDFSADLERNLFRLANFPFRLWTSLIVRGDGSYSTSSVLLRHGFIPSGHFRLCVDLNDQVINVHFHVPTNLTVKIFVY
ncbi:hypothetical protein Tco_0098888 [Tanacetum coccineum]